MTSAQVDGSPSQADLDEAIAGVQIIGEVVHEIGDAARDGLLLPDGDVLPADDPELVAYLADDETGDDEDDEPEVPAGFIRLKGRDFRVAETQGSMAVLHYAYLAKHGIDLSDPDGMEAMYDLIKSTIDDDEWTPFRQHAVKVRASTGDLLDVARQAIGVMTSPRPFGSPSGSSGGQSGTGTSSPPASSSPGSSTPRGITRSTGPAPASRAPILDDPRIRALVPVRKAAKLVRSQRDTLATAGA